MRDLLIFVIGLLTGVVVTAFLTPKSGTELREDLQHRYETRLQDLNQRMEQLQAQLRKTQEQAQAKVAEVTAQQGEEDVQASEA
jgi:gas vesicle protein